MAFQKIIVVLSGSGSTGLVKLSGSFDGLNKVRIECKYDCSAPESKLWIIADDVTEIDVNGEQKIYEAPISAKSDIYCLLSTGGRTLVGSSGGRAERRQLEGRIETYRREKARKLREQRESEALLRKKAREEEERIKASFEDAQAAQQEKEAEIAAAEVPTSSEQIYEKPRENTVSCTERTENEYGTTDNGRHEPQSASFAAPTPEERAAVFSSPTGQAAYASDAYARSVLQEGVTYDGTNFYHAVKPQLDEMFVRYPAEARLNSIVPNSKWVRIDVDNDDYYVLGVLYDMSQPTFICYGIPGLRSVAPPQEISDVFVWLPADSALPDGAGYWLIYQSAENGKCIK